MKKILALLAALALCAPALAGQHFLVPYGVQTKIDFELFNADGTNDIDEADGGTEIGCEPNEGTSNPSTNDYVDEGNYYSVVLTAAETATARLTCTVTPTGPIEILFIETYGHPLAQHPTLGANVLSYGTAQGGTANTLQLAAAESNADDRYKGATVCLLGTGARQCRLITAYVNSTDTATVNLAWDTNPTSGSYYSIYTGNQVYVSVNSDGTVNADVAKISGDATAADNAELVFDNTGFDMSNSTIGTVTTLTGNTPQTGDAFAVLAFQQTALVNCEVNTAFYAGDSQNFACKLTNLSGTPVTSSTGALTGLQIVVTSGAQIREQRFINATTWDATNSELRLTLSRGLPATLADAVTVVIR